MTRTSALFRTLAGAAAALAVAAALTLAPAFAQGNGPGPGPGPGGGTTTPPAGSTATITLQGQWTLVGWIGVDGISVQTALYGASGTAGGTTDITSKVSAVWGYNATTQAWQGYFPGSANIPGANDLTALHVGMGYFVALADPAAGPVQWVIATSSAAPLQSTLELAVDQKYQEHAFYQAVIDKFGNVLPFSNIVAAEQNQITAWTQLFTTYSLTVPADPWLGNVTAPATLHESCQAAVALEQQEITLFTTLVSETTNPQVLTVLNQQLTVAEQNHLPAFQAC